MKYENANVYAPITTVTPKYGCNFANCKGWNAVLPVLDELRALGFDAHLSFWSKENFEKQCEKHSVDASAFPEDYVIPSSIETMVAFGIEHDLPMTMASAIIVNTTLQYFGIHEAPKAMAFFARHKMHAPETQTHVVPVRLADCTMEAPVLLEVA